MPGENIQDWSTTAATNATADTSINWAEGQPRASVNNSARSMMAAHAKDRDLKNGSITTGGTANAQTFTSGVSYTSVPTGLTVRLKVGVTNTGATTLNMDGIGAVAIKDQGGADIGANALLLGRYIDLLYNGTNWILLQAGAAAAPFDALAYSGMQINGSMEVSQENGTTARTTVGYVVDGFQIYYAGTMVLSAAQVADAPPGLTNSIKISVTTAQASVLLADNVVLYTPIEGFRTSRLQFGTANAQAISLGFWTKIHRVGTYSGSVRNAAQNRSYPFNFTQNVADTWEFKTVTVPGDITGTWVGNTNGTGLTILFCMAGGSGVLGTANTWAAANLSGVTGTTNGVAATSDTFQITGVIVLPGSDAPSAARSPFIMRPYDQELQICRRYFQWNRGVVNDAFFLLANANFCLGPYKFAPQMRAVPTVTIYDGTTSGQALTFGGGTVGGVTAYSAVLGSDGLGAVQAAAFTAAVSFNVKADARL